uniref:Enoyl-[acyl-carrier-protein] reductase [NADH] n=1 Tax=Desulfacinum infernum TaxID=35837 RepID=A0A832A4Q3_9BACT
MQGLDGKKALVLGVANKMSLAWAIARAFRAHGADVALGCVESSRRRVEKLAREAGCGPVLVCDVRREDDIGALFRKLAEVFEGRLDILVHSIAYADLEYLGGEFIGTPRRVWTEALEISAYSFLACVREGRPLLRASQGASVITLSYAGSREVVPGYNIMGVAKAALESAVRYLAYDLGPENIRINALSPGPVRTVSALAVQNFETALKVMESHAPMLRNVTAEEVAAAALFLASPLSRAMTGCVLPVDAGAHILCRPSIARCELKR